MKTYSFGKCEICGKETNSHNGMIWREKGNNRICFFGTIPDDKGFRGTCRKISCKRLILNKMLKEGKLWDFYKVKYPELLN